MYMYTYKRYETTDNALIERSFKQQNDISILTSLFFQIVHLLFNRILGLLRTRWWEKISFHFVTVCGYLIAWGTVAYSFDIDYEYHYEYKANSVVLGKFPVVTIAKVNLLICFICIK